MNILNNIYPIDRKDITNFPSYSELLIIIV